ncbi:MAG: hypothetical protein AAF488_18910 [Planctomycetota bacterium]
MRPSSVAPSQAPWTLDSNDWVILSGTPVSDGTHLWVDSRIRIGKNGRAIRSRWSQCRSDDQPSGLLRAVHQWHYQLGDADLAAIEATVQLFGEAFDVSSTELKANDTVRVIQAWHGTALRVIQHLDPESRMSEKKKAVFAELWELAERSVPEG